MKIASSVQSLSYLGWARLLAFVIGVTGGRALYAEDVPIRLQEPFPPGYQYHVHTRVEATGKMTLPTAQDRPARSLTIVGNSAVDYEERVLKVDDAGQVRKTARIYRRFDMERTINNQSQKHTLRPSVRRLILLRYKNVEVPFSPDGPLMWSEIDLVRTDVFTPALLGLLPSQPVRIGDRWTPADAALQELTDLEKIEAGQAECRLEEIVTLQQRRLARVAFTGKVRGTNEDGPNQQHLDGYYFFDLESKHLGYLTFKGINSLLDKNGKEIGRIEGHFVLTRQAHRNCPDLSDAALRGIALEPNADNTPLLYEDSDLGVRFLYPRRWRLAGGRGRQLALDGADGSGLMLTLEPLERLPTGAQFLAESRAYLQGQKAKFVSIQAPQRIEARQQQIEHFAIEVELVGQRVLMDYYVIRQAQGGVILAARLPMKDLATLQKELERIARSITIVQAIRPTDRGPNR